MIIIVCLDDNGGMMFNHRRQSQDRVLRRKITELVGNSRLWMNHDSAKQFEGCEIPKLNIDESFLQEAMDGDYCFVENVPVAPYEPWIERLIIFRWNRVYPADQHFDLDISSHTWKIVNREEFEGYSHKCITMEVLEK